MQRKWGRWMNLFAVSELDLQNQILSERFVLMFSKVQFYIPEKIELLHFVLINISTFVVQIWYLF